MTTGSAGRGVKAMNRAQEGAVAGAGDGGGPAGEAWTAREAPGEGGPRRHRQRRQVSRRLRTALS
jgi:hypothetical protein